ncbi:hypothetical protein GCM10010174_46620 [Kutzneria viridogrisea]|uniref:IrrE N-terminal-like domain-containing protein n=2 Tax=Kutzneria TaxID=43356 RepID=W5W5P0_9PSEU|nr:hypothetical protein [Kutzneria albida]AHH95786.1 hypothetical protein KALB_2418 [Kutzneria albida DSM 43870]MBA8926694.1 hypothetical protein [Kutzneria viridogrisea]
MGRNNLRRRCREVVAGIELPVPFTAQELCERLAERRSRPLHLHALPVPTPPGLPSGMWLATEQADHILYDSQTSRLHQDHIILHEIGHMLCDHEAGNKVLHRELDLGLVDPDQVLRVLPRVHYDSHQEQEAEMIASLVLEGIGRLPAPSPFTGLLAGLERSIGFRRRSGR